MRQARFWHEIFGHINYKYLSDLSEKDMVIGLPKIKFSKGVCQGCILGKQPEHKFERASHERTSAPLELIHNDIAGPFPHMSMSKVIAKGVVDHTLKVYMFSHFLPYSNPSALLIHANEASKMLNFHMLS